MKCLFDQYPDLVTNKTKDASVGHIQINQKSIFLPWQWFLTNYKQDSSRGITLWSTNNYDAFELSPFSV